jgi:hypothetical protein
MKFRFMLSLQIEASPVVNKTAILFCGNCFDFCFDEVLRKLAGHRILVMTYQPYTSHIFRELDVLLFGIIKR